MNRRENILRKELKEVTRHVANLVERENEISFFEQISMPKAKEIQERYGGPFSTPRFIKK